MKKRGTVRVISVLVALLMLIGLLPVSTYAAYDEEGTTYVRVNSVSDIVPNARYVILAEYSAEGVETEYFAMSDSTNTYDDVRVGYTALTYTDEDSPHFELSDDKQSLTLHSDSILKVRLRKATYSTYEDLYKMEIDGEGYLYGFCNSYYYYGTSCCRELSVLNNTRGKPWWHFRMGENGYWQIATYMDANNSTDIVSLAFNDAYGDFMSYLYADNVRLDGEEYFFGTYITTDRDTNIWLYREVCEHKAADVTHVPAVAADCKTSGNVEYWFCAGCETYSSKADISEPIAFEDVFIAPTPHTSACGHDSEEGRFEPYIDSSMSSNQSGEHFILLGRSGDKYYAMGNVTNADGSRNAIEVEPNANGIVSAESDEVEFLEYYWPDSGDNGFLIDDGYFSVIDSKIIVYDKALSDTSKYIPYPARFSLNDWETGAGNFYAYSAMDTSNKYVVFDPENLVFKVQKTRDDSTYLYHELCKHTNMEHVPGATPTCTEQGAYEYWYCGDCYNYYQNENFEVPVEIYGQEDLTKPAMGHTYEDGVCVKCGMPRTYSQISTLEEFDSLSEKATYIMVIKDGANTYAAAVLPENPCDVDSDGDGIVDMMETDTNENGIADCIEAQIENWGGADVDEDGTVTVEEYNEYIGDMDGDEDVDFDDYALFFEYNVYWELYMYYEEQMYDLPNFVEVVMNSDGTVTVGEDIPMEFQMMEAGVWGGQLGFEEDFEYEGILDTERMRAAWVPNYWIGASGQMGYYGKDHFVKQYRMYGDYEMPGIMDHKNWKISFNPDGTACLVNTWESFDDTGAIQLVKYTDSEGNPQMTIVGVPEWLWEDSEIMSARTELLPVYLYAAEPENLHECEFGDWTDDENGRTHTRTCTDSTCGESETKEHTWSDYVSLGKTEHERACDDCGAVETKEHIWDDGVVTTPADVSKTGEITYTCIDCGSTKTEVVPKTVCEHSFGEWVADDGKTHTRTCENEGCGVYQRKEHRWGSGVVTLVATETSEGEITYTCLDCGGETTEALPMLEHTHSFGDWTSDGEHTHTRKCENGSVCTASETEEHSIELWTDNYNGTHSGNCYVCGNEATEPHNWSDWSVGTTEDTYIRNCECGATEEMTVQKPIEESVVNTTASASNGAAAIVLDSPIELFNNVLTEDEQTAVAEGSATVSVYLEVCDIPENSVVASDKIAAEEAAMSDESLGSDARIGMYLDIDLFKEVTTVSGEDLTSETLETQITETAGKITVTVEVPAELINSDDSVNRIYRIIRVHEDEYGNLITDVIEGVFDPEANTFTFETDKFSTYALAYNDESTYVPTTGDLNKDGEVTTIDLIYLSRGLAEWVGYEISAEDAHLADIDGDGDVTVIDYVYLARHLARWSGYETIPMGE